MRVCVCVCVCYCIAPSGLEVVLITGTSVNVSLDDLNCTESHGAISGYVVQYNMVTDADTTLVMGADNHTVILTLSSLNPCTNHSIRIAAVNKEGKRSSFSGPILVATLPEQSMNTLRLMGSSCCSLNGKRESK